MHSATHVLWAYNVKGPCSELGVILRLKVKSPEWVESILDQQSEWGVVPTLPTLSPAHWLSHSWRRPFHTFSFSSLSRVPTYAQTLLADALASHFTAETLPWPPVTAAPRCCTPTLHLCSAPFPLFSWCSVPTAIKARTLTHLWVPSLLLSKDFGLLPIIFHCIINQPPNILSHLPFKSRNNKQNLSWTPCLTPGNCSRSFQLLLPNYSNNLSSVIVFIVSLPLLFSFFRK